jgi:PAS domain S-box-containing protein
VLSSENRFSYEPLPPLGSAPGQDWRRTALPVVVTVCLLALGIANVVSRATTTEVEDGVLWVERAAGVVAAEVADPSSAGRAGVRPGDVLLAIDGQPVEGRDQVFAVQQHSKPGDNHVYTLLRLGTREVAQLQLAPLPDGAGLLYYLLASVGIFTLLVGAAVRARRPDDQATLHFFWLCVAFFGVLTFSFSGRLDRVDWAFYWSDVVALLLLPPLFLHFALVFPERPHHEGYAVHLSRWLPAVYLPAAVLGCTRVLALVRAAIDPDYFVRLVGLLDRLEMLYLAVFLTAGLIVLLRALTRSGSVTCKRQRRWIGWGTALGAMPFALGYAVPFALGVEPSLPMELSAVPLGFIPVAFASAIVRYRLMDVEIILKRLLVYTAAVAASIAIFVAILRTSGGSFIQSETDQRWVIAFLATIVVILLAKPVKDGLQRGIDRAFYRDRYDYRRALVGFARDLNADIVLDRLAERLVTRVGETIEIDTMAFMLASDVGDFEALHVSGIESVPRLSLNSGIGSRVGSGQAVRLDDPLASTRFTAEEVEFWRDTGIYYFVPCVSKGSAVAALLLGRRESGEPLTTEDLNLVTAVAGQAAVAIENGRLYRQLHLKASELDRLRSFNENILESLDDGLMVLGLDDRIIRWNQALEQLYGPTRAEAMGQSLERLFDPAVVNVLRAQRRDQPQGASAFRVPLAARHRTGNPDRLVNITTVPLQAISAGAPASGTIVIFEDITERTQLEEQLRISEKMASLGILAAGVAHEVNTPLTGISSYTQMLLEGSDPEDPRTAVLEKIEKQTFRAARIVNGLLHLSRSNAADASERTVVDVNAVVGDVLALLEHQFEKGSVKIRRELADGVVPTIGFEFKLQQVFLNLFLNARDAMPSGGWLTIATRQEGHEVVAEVSDTGTGIASEHLDRIYDPFFTTKPIGQGTGLGLSITYGIVREHDASIQCQSAPGQGTRFTLRFKLAQTNAQLAAM